MDEVAIRACEQNSSTLGGLVEAGLARPPERVATELPAPVDIGRSLSDEVVAGRGDERS